MIAARTSGTDDLRMVIIGSVVGVFALLLTGLGIYKFRK